jgi:hypothetical protein
MVVTVAGGRSEQDHRVAVLESFLQTPHRELERVQSLHGALVAEDPRFYVQLAAWSAAHGVVRDHNQLFVANLVVSSFPGHRDVGLALLRGMPLYQVVRVVSYVVGAEEVRKERVRPPKGTKARGARSGAAPVVVPVTPRETRVKVGLFREPPGSLRTEVRRYLRDLERHEDRWDRGYLLVGETRLKALYRLLHIAPGPRANTVLYDREVPPGSPMAALKEIARSQDPLEKARLVVAHKIPWKVAQGLFRASETTPVALLALVDSMSPQDVINSLKFLTRKGATQNPDIKAAIDAKLVAARTSTRVVALKRSAVDDQGQTLRETVGEDLGGKLDAIAGAQLDRYRITKATALLVDKSQSMTEAIDLGKRLAAHVAPCCRSGLHVVAFDDMVYEIVGPTVSDLPSWERAFLGITARGRTALGAGVEWLRARGHRVEQLVVISDGEEVADPRFTVAYQRYREATGIAPEVVYVKVGGTVGGRETLPGDCRAAHIPLEVWPFRGDYMSLPNLLGVLARGSRFDLLQEVMGWPLPQRRPG